LVDQAAQTGNMFSGRRFVRSYLAEGILTSLHVRTHIVTAKKKHLVA